MKKWLIAKYKKYSTGEPLADVLFSLAGLALLFTTYLVFKFYWPTIKNFFDQFIHDYN